MSPCSCRSRRIPWLFSAEGSAVWVKSADSGPSPSQSGCMWNLEQRCNVGENSSCLDEARSASLSTRAYQPPFPLPHSLSVCLSVPGMPLAVTVRICVSLCVMFSVLSSLLVCILLMLHSPCWLVGPLCLSAIPLFSSLLFCLPPSFISCLLSLSSSPPCLSHLLCPLPDCCIPALPSDREGWIWVCVV